MIMDLMNFVHHRFFGIENGECPWNMHGLINLIFHQKAFVNTFTMILLWEVGLLFYRYGDRLLELDYLHYQRILDNRFSHLYGLNSSAVHSWDFCYKIKLYSPKTIDMLHYILV